MIHEATARRNAAPIATRFKMCVAVHLLLMRKNEVLLLLRQGTGYCDGYNSVIAGHIDVKESATAAIIREAAEEAGIAINANDLNFSCVMHRLSSDHESIDFFYICHKWKKEIQNLEPHKCGNLSFYDTANLPPNMVDYVREGIAASLANRCYSEFGWNVMR